MLKRVIVGSFELVMTPVAKTSMLSRLRGSTSLHTVCHLAGPPPLGLITWTVIDSEASQAGTGRRQRRPSS